MVRVKAGKEFMDRVRVKDEFKVRVEGGFKVKI